VLARHFGQGVQGIVMSYSYTTTTTESFTLTHAKRLAAKVAADMHQCQWFYGHLTDRQIENYEQELVILLRGEYVESYEFGFETRDGQRVVSWFYTVGPAGDLQGGRSGGLFPTADISEAVPFNFLSHNSAWTALPQEERDRIEASLPVQRTEGKPPQDGKGYWDSSRSYASGGVAMTRKEFRPW
jgi:hypothetical protein